jgi:predicted PurR-regulated permease PerM
MAPSDHLAKSARMLASIAVVVAALYLAKGVLVPMTLAVLLSFLLSPVCDWLERHWLGRAPAVVVTALVGFTVLGGATWMAVVQMSDLAPRMPEYESNLKSEGPIGEPVCRLHAGQADENRPGNEREPVAG